MSELVAYIEKHTFPFIREGDPVKKRHSKIIDYKNFIKSTIFNDQKIIDVYLFKVKIRGDPDIETFKKLIKGVNGNFEEINYFDGKEHSYLSTGDWVGSNEMALRFFALGEYFNLWELYTPNSVLSDLSREEKDRFAELGFISIQYNNNNNLITEY